MSEITWGTSQQNRLTLILDGHEFQKKLETKTTTHWKCSKWSSYKCKVTAITTEVWPEKILLDFEKAAINIFSEQYL